jgi:hypothetical protein
VQVFNKKNRNLQRISKGWVAKLVARPFVSAALWLYPTSVTKISCVIRKGVASTGRYTVHSRAQKIRYRYRYVTKRYVTGTAVAVPTVPPLLSVNRLIVGVAELNCTAQSRK